MTQDMGNKISHHNQAVARELAGSKQALGRLMSMVRSRLGASKEQARSWLKYGLEQTFYSHAWNKIFPHWEQNIPTLGTKHSQARNKMGLRLALDELTARASRHSCVPAVASEQSSSDGSFSMRLRFVVTLLLMMVVGVSGVKAQTSGLYYIANNNDKSPYYNSSTPSTNYYLVPASDGGEENININTWAWNDNAATPFVTTYKTNKDNNSVWLVKKMDNSSYYYLIHVLTGKYITLNTGVGSNKNRRTFHMEDTSSPGDDHLYNFTSHTDPPTYYSINPKSKTTGHCYLNPSKANQPKYYGTTVENNYAVGGLIGTYNNSAIDSDGAGSKWYLETASKLAATIITITMNDETSKAVVTFNNNELPTGYNIRYTFGDGTQAGPDASSTIMDTSGYEVTTAGTLKVVIERYGVVLTEVASQAVTPIAIKPQISYDSSTHEVTIESATDGSTFYFTTDGSTDPDPSDPTQQYNPSQKPTISGKTTIKAMATKSEFRNSVVATMTIYYDPVTLSETSVNYDGTDQIPTVYVKDGESDIDNTKYTISYQKAGEEVAEMIDAGIYTVIVSDVEGDDEIVCGTASFTISPLTATLNWDNISLPYNKTAQVPTATVGNLVSGDECTVTVSGGQTNVGSYTATATGLSNSNYALPDVVTHAFSIIPKDVIFSGITAAGKVYDKTTTATLDYSSVTFGGLIAGDVLTISATGAFVDANAGENKTVNITDPVLGGGSVANYQLAAEGQQTTTTATISKKPVTVSGGVTVQNKVYDGTTTATFDCSSATIDGKIAGDDLTVSATGTFANPNVGEGITVTFTSFVLEGESADNYVLESSGQQASTTANITPATLTVTADAKTKVYGEADPALTYTPTGLAEGDNLATILNNGALTRVAGENVGSYAIGQGTLDLVSNSGNYTLSYVGANLTINEKSLNEGTELAEGITIEITKSGDAYVPVVQNNGTDINVNDYTISTSGDPDSKYYEVTIEGANNYSGSVTIKYANYKSGKKDTTDETEDWSGTFVSDSGDGDIAIPSGMSAYIVTGVNGNAVEVEELDFIPEGEPVLLLSDDFAYCFVVKAKEGEGTADTSGNLLEKATATETLTPAQIYILYNGEFVLNAAGPLAAGTVYLPKPTVAGSRPVYARLFINWGEATGIENAQISDTSPKLSGTWYTLDGRRLTNKPVNKGLYLRNREKIIIR